MKRSRLSVLSVGLSLLLLTLGGGCATVPQATKIPAAPSDYAFEIAKPRAAVFDALLLVAQSLNLSVDVLEKNSGFIQFKQGSLSPYQLDEFCIYPYVNANSVQTDTFSGWNQRSTVRGGGAVHGTVSISIVLGEAGAEVTKVKLHGTWVASNLSEVHEVGSRGVLENRIEKALKAQLGPT